ncbi:hypothetical protein WJX72_009194 [[Myrmecia] bisecta]|uniref:RNA helicase n=1 Tax=[Myrmecia] bisecta TaxID=41462 RepID=A0AAW1Q9M2_9CHLO
MDSIFAALSGGTHFDKQRFEKEVKLFTGASPPVQQPPAVALAAEPAAAAKSGKKRERKTQQGTSPAHSNGDHAVQPAAEAGISLFNSQAAEPRDNGGAAAAPEELPVVRTGDPFEEANVIRKQFRIRVAGSDVPAPLKTFDELGSKYGLSKRLQQNVAELGFSEPTPIQRQAVPALLAGRELFAIAPTGSGKTLAFLLPIVAWLRHQATHGEGQEGLKAVVLSPTRELAAQSARCLLLIVKGLKLRCSLLSRATAEGTDFFKVDILLANPLRLAGLVSSKQINLSSVRYLVMDEADKLFDMNFVEQIDCIIAACTHPHVVRALFSATLPQGVEELARSVLKDPLRVTVGERNTAVSSIKQRLVFVGRESGKLIALRQLIAEGLKPPILLFVSSKDRAQELHRELMFEGVHADSIHADQGQAARQAAVDNFRSGKTWLLIATDLVGRGMDFLGVNSVINYDFPQTTTDYIHRVGRTGRAGRTGEAVTFYMEEDKGRLRAIANIIHAAGGEVPDWMLQLKKERQRTAKSDKRPRSTVSLADYEKQTERRKARLEKNAAKRAKTEHLDSNGHA